MRSLLRAARSHFGSRRGARGRLVRPALLRLEDRTVPSTGIIEIPLNPAVFITEGITLGPDLNVWFTEYNVGRIGRVTPNGTVTEFNLPEGGSSSPTGITTGPDGNLWFVEPGNQNKIARMTTTGQVTEFQVSLGMFSNLGTFLVAGPDGNLWFTATSQPSEHTTATGQIGRITPQGAITLYPVPATHQFYSWTVGPDGNLWEAGVQLTNPFQPVYTPEVGAITLPTATNANPVFTFYTQGITGAPAGITTGPDGKLWFTETNTSHPSVGTITTAGAVTEYAIPASSGYMGAIVSGPDGNLWFTEQTILSPLIRIGRLSPAGVLEAEFVAPVSTNNSNAASGLVVGQHGDLYFGEGDNARLGEVQGVLDPNPRFVAKLYEDSLGRLATAADFAYWTPQVDAGNAAGVAYAINHSAEAYRHLVTGWYQTYLGRAPDPTGLTYFTGLLANGATQEQALGSLLASDEYYARSAQVAGTPASDATFVQALYQQLLGRPAGTADLSYWGGQLATAGRAAVTWGILTSGEYRTVVANGCYTDLLHWGGPVDPSAVQYYVQQPWDLTTMWIQFELTPLYFLNP